MQYYCTYFHSAWFLNETGHSNPYDFNLDPQTMREVAEAAETMGGGAERDGGMWGLVSDIYIIQHMPCPCPCP
jgi:hypothetical protein